MEQWTWSQSPTPQPKEDGRRKSQVNLNVRRMTMLPVEEMRKLSQMVQVRRSQGW